MGIEPTTFKPIFHLATLFARREAKTRIRQRDWLKLAGEKIRREQVGSVPIFLSVRANKVTKWKIGFKARFPLGEFVRANRQKSRNASYMFAANFFASQF